MNKISNLMSLAAVSVGLLFFSSCDNGSGGEEIPKKTGVLIVNAGNFGQGNGSVSFYDEELETISNNVIKNANNGAEIGAGIESIYQHDGVGFLVCNATDKVEFFSVEDYKYLDNPTTNISQPRYMTVVGDKGYITCWGPWSANFTLEESYVAVMDLSTKNIVDSLECGYGPEGIIAVNNKLYIANSFESSVTVIDLADESVDEIDLDAAPQHFAMDGTGTLWVTVSSNFGVFPVDKVGLQSINTSTDSKGSFVQVPGLSDDGVLAADGAGEKIYIFTTQPWPATETEVFVFNSQTKFLDGDALISGENFNGIGFNPTTDKLYVADAAGFAGNGKIMV
ncbi:MAG: hypothetical protein KAQ62_08125, partial [Cyclobacteriaceae bacterium]|nr:hypothetical protein [Cyclobacteriaceae bacterium]